MKIIFKFYLGLRGWYDEEKKDFDSLYPFVNSIRLTKIDIAEIDVWPLNKNVKQVKFLC